MIRRLKILISHKERELKTCDPKSRDRVRAKLDALKTALRLAKEERDVSIVQRSNLKHGCDHPVSGVAV